MDKSKVRSAVFRAIQEIESANGQAKSNINGSTRPIGGIAGFDSLNCVEASCLISSYLGREIPQDVGLFIAKGQACTLDEIVDNVCNSIGVKGDD